MVRQSCSTWCPSNLTNRTTENKSPILVLIFGKSVSWIYIFQIKLPFFHFYLLHIFSPPKFKFKFSSRNQNEAACLLYRKEEKREKVYSTASMRALYPLNHGLKIPNRRNCFKNESPFARKSRYNTPGNVLFQHSRIFFLDNFNLEEKEMNKFYWPLYQVRVYMYILSLVFFYLKKKENRYKSKNKIIHGRY